jgi:hypothetical protein
LASVSFLGECDLLDVFHVVDAVVARHDHAQRPAVSPGDRCAVHLPGEDGVLHGFQRDGAFHHDIVAVEPFGDFLAAGACHVVRPVGDAAEFLRDGAHGNPAPHHAARRAGQPGRAARLVVEEPASVARTLQHRRHRLDAEPLQFADAHAARIVHALERHLPGITIGHDLLARRREIVADEDEIVGRDDAGADEAALGLQREVGMDDQRLGLLPVDIGRKCPVLRQGRSADATGSHGRRADRSGRTDQEMSAVDPDCVLHGFPPVVVHGLAAG